MNKKFIAFLLCGLIPILSLPLSAQTPSDSSRLKPAPYAIGLQLGSTGIGLQAARVLSKDARWVGRVGVSYFSYDQVLRVKAGEGKLNITPDLVVGIALASVKWHPFKRNQLFVTGGAGYTWRPDLRANVIPEGNVKFGGLQIAEENAGVINASLRWNSVLGYAGFGYGRSTPIRRLGFAVELGCYYIGSPKVDLQYTGFLETTTIDEQLPVIQNNLRGYRFLPSLQFLVSYGLFRK
ncbi:hypothetical protein [Larkinella terrae]|uniref:Outer membrane beta-barrel protein n=1 Tax=Larkinella terrae TaxID=2025311 RepID=A0A7K0EJB6_9BACT|nr:hypothetical protein [Larkinella terrae]MRS61855.1 hypothetical protein [Larkinella terrae]